MEAALALFLSTFVNKVDRKGRVSVPATFRAVLSQQTFSGVVAIPSLVSAAIEGSGIDRFERLAEGIDDFSPFSDEHDDFSKAIFGKAHQLPFDGEGRIIIPENLLAHAGITERAAFVGQGRSFQIWEPLALAQREAEAVDRAKRDRASLKIPSPPSGEGAS
ncbi:MAG: division/cell wall cluster transcriptional repressor MraZ [Alphaproteobacteria bacterium]